MNDQQGDHIPQISYARVYPVYVRGRYAGRLLALNFPHALWLARLRHGDRARIAYPRR
jgi:hypothetical protein